MFHYKWMLRTIFPNLWWLLRNIITGIKNTIRWSPVIWKDQDWDWEYLADVMEYKFRRMSKLFKKYGHSIDSDKDARRTLICAELLKRLKNDNMDDLGEINRINVLRHNQRMAEWQEMLGRYIGKYLMGWWD